MLKKCHTQIISLQCVTMSTLPIIIKFLVKPITIQPLSQLPPSLKFMEFTIAFIFINKKVFSENVSLR